MELFKFIIECFVIVASVAGLICIALTINRD